MAATSSPAPSSSRRRRGRAPTTHSSEPASSGAGIAIAGIGAGFAPGLQVEIDGGKIDSNVSGASLAAAPTARAYLVPNRMAVTATPALLRVGAFADRAVAVDVAGRVGIALELGRIELDVDSPPLSYVSQSRWNALPITVRLGLRTE